jgi:hypothetical protein
VVAAEVVPVAVASTWSFSLRSATDLMMSHRRRGGKGQKAVSSAPVQFGSANLDLVQSQLQRFLCPG